MLRYFIYAITPLLVLLTALILSCTLGYFIVLGIGDAIPFRQILTRSTQLFLVLSIFPIMAYLKVNKEELGFAPIGVLSKQLLQGFGLGFIVLIPVLVVLYVLKVTVYKGQFWTVGLMINAMTMNLLVALLISVIEETLFRGIVLVGLKRKLPVIAAIILTSTYYAGLHFLSIKTNLAVQDITISSGFLMLGEAVGNLFRLASVPAFFALLMVGIFLGVLRTQKKISLGLCIGCHTSWVWLIKINKKLFNTDFSAQYHYLVSSYDGIIGPLVGGWIMIVIVAYFAYQHINRSKIELV
ncbi:MAG: type II CAAX prenyl endopeptidase Rce1 family protein [Methylococcales bacterium]